MEHTERSDVLRILVIPVAPAPKARPRVTKTGRTYTPDKTVDAEERIRWHLRQHNIAPYPKEAALALSLTFSLAKPSSKPRKAKYPVTRPDLDQYVKLAMDAMNGIAYEDDSQVCHLTTSKVYADGKPEIRIELWEMA